MQHSTSKAISKAAPRMEPITIPAIWPPDKRWPVGALPVAAPEVLVGDDVELDVEEGNRVGIEVTVGRVTPTQRLLTLDPLQHESVAFGELAAQ